MSMKIILCIVIIVLMMVISSIGIASAEYTTEQIGYNPTWDKVDYVSGDLAEIIISFNANYFDNTKYFYEVSIRNPNTGYSDIFNITIPQMRIEYPFDAPGTYDMDVFVADRTDINQGLILSHSYREVALMPPVYHAPTATATPEITPTSTPTPSPTPTPTPIILEITANSTPTTTPTPIPIQQTLSTQNEYGTLNFISDPSGANVYINGGVLREPTPTQRDLSPKGYSITITKEGFVNFTKNVIVRNLDNLSITVKLEPIIPVEQPQNNTIVTMSMAAQAEPNNTSGNNSSVANSPMASSQGIPAYLAFLAGLLIMAIGAVSVSLIPKKSHGESQSPQSPHDGDMENNEISIEDTNTKIVGLLRNDPTIKNSELAAKVRISERTLSRRLQELNINRKEGIN